MDFIHSRVTIAFIFLLVTGAPTFPQGLLTASSPQLEGDIRQVHDPTVIAEGGKYYLFSTRAGIAIRCSADLVRWRLCGDVFAHLPGWAVQDVPGVRGLWAPDVS